MAVVMLWWKQQVNTGYWRKNIYCKWNTAMRAFVLVFVHNQTSQLLFETVRWKHNHCDTRALRPRRDYKLAPLATLKPLASRELLLSQKKYNFSIFQTWFSRYPSPLQCWDMLKQAGDRRVSPGNSWCRGAARLSKSSPFFRPKLPATSKELNYFKFSLNLSL